MSVRLSRRVQPQESQWQRVEDLAGELIGVPAAQLPARMAELAAVGESPTVLTLLGAWLELPPPVAPLGVGDTVGGRYRLVEKLGEGGMGSVWRAHQELIGREVALKTLHPPLATPALNEQFLREMAILGQLDHPGIVRIFDAGIHQHRGFGAIPFFTMELVVGQPLDRWAAAHRRDLPALLRLAGGICGALQDAHGRGVVHRDLKPANILVRDDGRPALLDFGISRLGGIAVGDGSGAFSGTPRYAAPEQHRGCDVDFRSGESVDVYSFGVILFEMLSGQGLHDLPRGASMAETRQAILAGHARRLSEVMPDCPAVLEELVARAVRRDPRDRYYSMTELARALHRATRSLTEGLTAEAPWRPSPGGTVPGTPWRLDRKLGEGGIGEVWSAVHGDLGQRGVFKFCDSEEKVRSLRREATLYRLLKERVGRHPHFIALHDLALSDPPWYLLMDHVEAIDLATWCAAQPGGLGGVDVAIRVEIVAQAAEAVQVAHDAGILHRDLKPANLLIRTLADGRKAVGGGEVPVGLVHVYVTDFGIGQVVAEEFQSAGTRPGFTRTVSDLQRSTLAGTMLYLAPEVLEGSAAGVRSDVYSLGVVLWQLLVGNLSAALDPIHWAQRIEDPLLRADLTRCLAGEPEKRWSSAAEFAAALRDLPRRRVQDRELREQQAARERAAYRLGVARTAVAASAVLVLIGMLTWVAWAQRRSAMRTASTLSLRRAESRDLTDHTFGRRDRGLEDLEAAIPMAAATNLPAIRSAAAMILGLPDLRVVTEDEEEAFSEIIAGEIPSAKGEVVRAVSPDRQHVAVGRDLDGLNGAVEIWNRRSGEREVVMQRSQFPWIPVPESRLFAFAPNGSLLAIGGGATSRQVVLGRVSDGGLHSYLHHPAEPSSLAWHPGGRLLAVGCEDGFIRIWEVDRAVSANARARPGSTFDLPPKLEVPAQDVPVATLRGHAAAVRFLAFHAQGRWLASLDARGSLRIYQGFSLDGLPGGTAARSDVDSSMGGEPPDLPIAVEYQTPSLEAVTALEALGEDLILRRTNERPDRYRVDLGEMPAEFWVGHGLREVHWNGDGSVIGAMTSTDLLWLRSGPLGLLSSERGRNPEALAWDEPTRAWIVPSSGRVLLLRSGPSDVGEPERMSLKESALMRMATLPEAESGAHTVLAGTGDGRLALYRGRRVQFLHPGMGAPTHAVLLATDGGDFRSLMWDATGRLLTVVTQTDRRQLRLQCWTTTGEFPPTVLPLAPLEVESGQVDSANDGVHLVVRNRTRGLSQIDARTGEWRGIEESPESREAGPLAVSRDGRWVAMVVGQTRVRLLRLPRGGHFADLASRRASAIREVVWSPAGDRLITLTEDGHIQAWNLAPWLAWLVRQGIAGL